VLPSDLPVRYDELALRLAEQLPRAEPFALLAESFSGPLAIQVAASRPRGLRALVLVASFARRPVPAGVAALAMLAGPLVSRPPPAWTVRHFLVGRDADPMIIQEVRSTVAAVPPAVIRARIRAALAVDATEALGRCEVPILYLAGTEDRLLRRGVPAELGQSCARVEVVSICAPHLVLQTEPRTSALAIAEFLARSGGGT
jgi:pimeloyl-ACP methyl ester carboxylesterase